MEQNKLVERKDILSEAIHKCIKCMYKWSQPSIDIDELIASGFKDSQENPLYKRHYLAFDNFIYIRDIYKEAYGITDEWDNTFDTLIKYLVNGGVEDYYKPATKDRPGYRDYKEVPSLESRIGKENTEICLEHINKCKNFFKYHSNEINSFDFTVSLGVGSPNSNKEAVTEYWQNHGRPDFKIVDFSMDEVIYGDDNIEEFIESLKQSSMINKRIVITFLKEQPVVVILKENDNTQQYYKANPKYYHNNLFVLMNNLVFNKIADTFRLVNKNKDTK